MKKATTFTCKHCSFPVIVNNQYRALLNLQPFNYLSFEEVAMAQIGLVGRARYTLAKSKRHAKLEDELRSSCSRLPPSTSPGPEVRSKRKRWQRTKQKQKNNQKGVSMVGNNTAATCFDKDLSSRFIQSKGELIALSKWGNDEGRCSGLKAISTIEEKLHFLQMLYTRDRHWTSFGDVSSESHENVRCICDLSEISQGESVHLECSEESFRGE
jgi:hypothetical protein